MQEKEIERCGEGADGRGKSKMREDQDENKKVGETDAMGHGKRSTVAVENTGRDKQGEQLIV